MPSRNDMVALDAADPLRTYRDSFALPDGVIYLDGNSLGALPKAAVTRAQEVVTREWGDGLIRSWNDADWIGLPQAVGAKVAQLIGAAADEVVACDSTSVNLFKQIAAALALRPDRRVVLTDEKNFPTDGYIAQGIARWMNVELRRVPVGDIEAAIDNETAVVALTHVDYLSGRVLDMASITAMAHAKGALTLWDLSHSAGALPVDLNGCKADLAVGCGYKYLNGGPGAPAYLYVARAHQQAYGQPITGWMGHADPFAFAGDYAPAPGIDRALAGTPSVIQLAILETALDTLVAAGMTAIREKSRALGDLFIARLGAHCPGLALASPADSSQRGSQVSFHHEDGYAVIRALIARGVIGDFRTPDIMRFGFAPLYVRYTDVWDAAEAVSEVLTTESWREARFQARQTVT